MPTQVPVTRNIGYGGLKIEGREIHSKSVEAVPKPYQHPSRSPNRESELKKGFKFAYSTPKITIFAIY
uniref:'chromo' domain containing protein n=1 Tax=Panagrellus redivivus TaxID=6233 RepID=A0A7E4W6T3_PANRE